MNTLTKSGALKLSEKQITEQCIGYLRAMGWLCVRLETGTFQRGGKNIGIGEKGQPDWICVIKDRIWDRAVFVEFKTAKGSVRKEQEQWHSWAAMKGYIVVVARSLEDITPWA